MLLMIAGIAFLQLLGESCLCLRVILGSLMLCEIANNLNAVFDRHPGRV